MSTIPPRVICCDITDPSQPVTATHRYAMHQGDTYEDEFQVTDTAGDPVDMTGFTASMQFRAGPIDEGWPVIATATVTFTSAAIGTGEFSVASADTALMPEEVYSELQVANSTNPLYADTYKATVFRMHWVCSQQVTA